MSGLLRYLSAYVLDSFRERVTGEDFEGETIFRVGLIGSPSDGIRSRIARMFPKSQIRAAEVGRSAVIVIPMAGGPAPPRLFALLGRARHKLLVPSPDYVYRFGMRRGAPALLWAVIDRLLLWPLALARLVLSVLWMYLSGLAQAAGAAQARAGRNPRRLAVIRLTPTRTFVGLLQRLRARGGVRIAAVLSSPEGEQEVAAVADEIIYASSRGIGRAVRRVRQFAPDAAILAGGADYGLGPTYLKAALLARLSGAARRVQWEVGESLPGRPLGERARRAAGEAWRRRCGGAGGSVRRRLALARERRSYQQRPRRGPGQVQVGITEACNYHCIMCPFHNPAVDGRHREAEQPRMSYPMFVRLVSDLRRLGTEIIDLYGDGEPLTHPDAMEMIAFARELGLKVTLATNGGLLTEERARKLVDIGLERIHVSINAGTDEVYARMHPGTPPGSLTRLVGRLAQMAEYAEQTAQRKVFLETSAVITRLNMHEIPRMVRAAHAARSDTFLLIVMGEAEGQADLQPTEADWVEIRKSIAEAREVGRELNLRIDPPELEVTASAETTKVVYDQIPCYMGHEFSLILANGAVKFCCYCYKRMGTLHEADFPTIWRSEKYQAMREQAMALPQTKTPPEECSCFRSCCHAQSNIDVHRRLYGEDALRFGS